MNCPKCNSTDVGMLGFGAYWKCHSCFEISADAEMIGTPEDKAMSEKTKRALVELARHVSKMIDNGEFPESEAS